MDIPHDSTVPLKHLLWAFVHAVMRSEPCRRKKHDREFLFLVRCLRFERCAEVRLCGHCSVVGVCGAGRAFVWAGTGLVRASRTSLLHVFPYFVILGLCLHNASDED